jgi:CRISPR-associated protein Csm3
VDSGLRKTERVPAGVQFTLDMSLRVMDTDNKIRLLNTLLTGLALLQMDALGGSGSRGYGKVEFDALAIEGQPLNLPEV